MRIFSVADVKKEALEIQLSLKQMFNIEPVGIEVLKNCKMDTSDVLIVLGGDGFLLHVVHSFFNLNAIPSFYGINYGTFGFLLNSTPESADDVLNDIASSKPSVIYPLKMDGKMVDGSVITRYAVNEVSMLRETNQVAKLKVSVNGVVRMEELVSDGIVISTGAGSTAYNFSVHGPIFNLDSNLISMCPISPFRPRHWRGALLDSSSIIKVEVIDSQKRPTSISSDFIFDSSVIEASVRQDVSKPIKLLFNTKNPIKEKIIKEQFAV